MTYFRNHRRGLEKDRRCPALRPPELGENRRGAVRRASPFSAAYPLRGGYFPGGHGLGQPGAGVRCAGRIGCGQPGLLGELQQRADTASGSPQSSGLRIRRISQGPGAILVGAVALRRGR